MKINKSRHFCQAVASCSKVLITECTPRLRIAMQRGFQCELLEYSRSFQIRMDLIKALTPPGVPRNIVSLQCQYLSLATSQVH